jgi:hypothetical protein
MSSVNELIAMVVWAMNVLCGLSEVSLEEVSARHSELGLALSRLEKLLSCSLLAQIRGLSPCGAALLSLFAGSDWSSKFDGSSGVCDTKGDEALARSILDLNLSNQTDIEYLSSLLDAIVCLKSLKCLVEAESKLRGVSYLHSPTHYYHDSVH